MGIEVAQYVMDPTDMVGADNAYGETLSQIIKDEGFVDASISAAYQPVPTHGSSHRVAQRLTGPPMVNGRTTEATAKPRFVRICYEKMFKGRCDKRDCKYCHDEQVIKAFVKAHPERYADSPYHCNSRADSTWFDGISTSLEKPSASILTSPGICSTLKSNS